MADFPYPLTPDVRADLWRFFGAPSDDIPEEHVKLPCDTCTEEGSGTVALIDTPFSRAFVAWREGRGPVVDRSCYTCDHNNRANVGCAPFAQSVPGVSEYVVESGARTSGMPRNRKLACPGWAKKEEG